MENETKNEMDFKVEHEDQKKNSLTNYENIYP
jgi:hypothetical protein